MTNNFGINVEVINGSIDRITITPNRITIRCKKNTIEEGILLANKIFNNGSLRRYEVRNWEGLLTDGGVRYGKHKTHSGNSKTLVLENKLGKIYITDIKNEIN